MDLVVLPNMGEDYQRERAIDEMPQSAARPYHYDDRAESVTPEQSVQISVDASAVFNVRMIALCWLCRALENVEGRCPNW